MFDFEFDDDEFEALNKFLMMDFETGDVQLPSWIYLGQGVWKRDFPNDSTMLNQSEDDGQCDE